MTAARFALNVSAEGLRKSWRGRLVLDVPRIALAPGRTLALLGPSGAGKSTLLGLLGLLEKPDDGRVFVDGREVTTRDHEIRRHTAAVFQRPFLFKGSVATNVAYGLRLRRVPVQEQAERVAEALGLVGLGGWQERSALTLSGGEAQRVALARALVLQPRFLLFDEPLSQLDPLLKGALARDFARILKERDVTTLYVTHDQNEALVVADDVAVMREGRVVASGAAADVMGLPPDEWTAAFLGMEAPLAGRVVGTSEGIAAIACGQLELFAAAELAIGDSVLVGVRPEDVLLFEDAAVLPASSARNVLHARVVELEHSGATWRVTVEAGGVRLAASVSSAAVADLALTVGAPVRAVFKATAVRVRRENN